MSSTYTGDPANSDKDAVRFLIQDTGPSFRITDEEIVWMLGQEGNLWMASAVLCEKLTTIITGGGLSSKSVGSLSESYSTGSVEFYQQQAKVFRVRGSARQVPVMSYQMKQVFGARQFDYPGVYGPKVKDPCSRCGQTVCCCE